MHSLTIKCEFTADEMRLIKLADFHSSNPATLALIVRHMVVARAKSQLRNMISMADQSRNAPRTVTVHVKPANKRAYNKRVADGKATGDPFPTI